MHGLLHSQDGKKNNGPQDYASVWLQSAAEKVCVGSGKALAVPVAMVLWCPSRIKVMVQLQSSVWVLYP